MAIVSELTPLARTRTAENPLIGAGKRRLLGLMESARGVVEDAVGAYRDVRRTPDAPASSGKPRPLRRGQAA